jgi:transcriptional regulator with XRE-family HTH domain
LSEELLAFLTFAPTPAYTDAALAAIEAEPALIEALRTSSARGGLLPNLLKRLRERFEMTTSEVAGELVGELGLAEDRAPKTAGYLERLEAGRLEPTRVSHRVFDALGRVFGLTGSELEGAADAGSWSPVAAPAAAPVFRAEKDAAAAAERHLEVLADALAAPGGEPRDEVDDLFLGGR